MIGKDGRFYDRSYDFDGDGTLNAYEYSVMDDEMFSSGDADSLEDDDLDDELEIAGLDPYELENMDEEERIEALEDAGLDPDDFDF